MLDVVVLSIQPKASLCDHLRRVADVKHAVRGTKQMDVRVVLLRQDDRLKTMPEVLTRVLTELYHHYAAILSNLSMSEARVREGPRRSSVNSSPARAGGRGNDPIPNIHRLIKEVVKIREHSDPSLLYPSPAPCFPPVHASSRASTSSLGTHARSSDCVASQAHSKSRFESRFTLTPPTTSRRRKRP